MQHRLSFHMHYHCGFNLNSPSSGSSGLISEEHLDCALRPLAFTTRLLEPAFIRTG